MIIPAKEQTSAAVAQHYDDLNPFYRELWGDHVHHGLWTTGLENPAQAVENLIACVARRLALLWRILSGTGFPNQFFCDSWEVGFWRGRPWLAGHRIGRGSLDAFSSRFWIGLLTRRGAKCVRFACLG
jgi:hypothetical protein